MGSGLCGRRSRPGRRVLAMGARRALFDGGGQPHSRGRPPRSRPGAVVHQLGTGLASARARGVERAQHALISVQRGGRKPEPTPAGRRPGRAGWPESIVYRSSGPVRGTSLGAEDHTTYLLSVPVLDTEGSGVRAGVSGARAGASGARAGVSRAVSNDGGEPPLSRPSPAPAAVGVPEPVPGP